MCTRHVVMGPSLNAALPVWLGVCGSSHLARSADSEKKMNAQIIAPEVLPTSAHRKLE